MAAVYVGASGLSYPAAKGSFYPRKMAPKDALAFYASRLPTIEVNTTFYGNPRPEVIAAWVKAVPEDFRFAVKASRWLTHASKERLMRNDVSRFAETLKGFGGVLGPILFQFPATHEYQPDRLQPFLDRLPSGWRAAFQFRHPSWHVEAVNRLIESAGHAVCHADGEEDPGPVGRGAFLYFRLRREAYGRAALSAWRRRFQEYAEAGRDVYAYFKHEGRAPSFALQAQTSARIEAARAL
jgi:uncharacterized protein YecE (DUF72 family)